jgi:hypothetical protein
MRVKIDVVDVGVAESEGRVVGAVVGTAVPGYSRAAC